MYHCTVNFYLTGTCCKELEAIKQITPMDNFKHEFFESVTIEEYTLSKSNVIFCNANDNINGIDYILGHKKEDTQLIVLINREQLNLLQDKLMCVEDVWFTPLSEDEIQFRFLKWQQKYKVKIDLWEKSNFLDSAINHSPNLLWFKDKDGVHELVNDKFCSVVNKSKEQIKGQRHAYIWDVEEDDPACIESENKVMSSEKTLVAKENIRVGSEERNLEVYKSPLYDVDGSVMGTVGIGIDITKERMYRNELLLKTDTLEKIFTNLDCGIICHSIDGKTIISINQTALDILGYETQEELEESGFDMVAMSVIDEDKLKLYTAIKSLRREGDSVSVEYKVKHKDNKIIYVLGNIKLMRVNDEFLYQRFMLDTTFQKLQESKDKRQYSEMIQALSVGYELVCSFDTSIGLGKAVQFSNVNIDEVFDGIFSGDILLEGSMKHYIDRFVHKDDRVDMKKCFTLANVKEMLSCKKCHYINYRSVCEDGNILYYQIKIVAINTAEGSYSIVLGFRNINDEIKGEMDKKEMMESLLSQLKAANEAKTLFLSNMSHDIRTPINAIVGFTNLAMNHIEDEDKVKDYLSKIKGSGEHMLGLLNNVLDITYIESGKMSLEEKDCDLADLVKSIRNIMQTAVKDKEMKLTFDFDNITNTKVYCDTTRLSQVFLNLLTNSVKYTHNGGSITFSGKENILESNEYSEYEFHIKDNGIGMSKEFLAHIFEPFEREKNTTYSGVAGAGLGMAITKNIVDMMHGKITVDSEEGVGTEFTVILMLRRSNQEKNDIETEKSVDIDTDRTELITQMIAHGCRILLVEDNELNQEIACEILKEEGYIVDVADNGKIAVEMLQQSEPGYYQVILMDVQMPVMNGYAATQAIRNLDNKELASIPIIAMTANAFEEDRQEAFKSGMNEHIAKPIDVDLLLNILKKVIII